MFSVKIVAKPDARMVEVPLELESELPREFEGQAVLASSGVPRKVKLRAAKDALKLSTAYRADVLLADIVRLSLRGTAVDMQRIQDAAQRFVRLVRERRPDGASLTVLSNGRGKIEVAEAGTGAPSPTAAPRSSPPSLTRFTPSAAQPGAEPAAPASASIGDKLAALERRVSQLEAALPQVIESHAAAGGGDELRMQGLEDRDLVLEERIQSLQSELHAAESDTATRLGALEQRVQSAVKSLEERLAQAEAPPAPAPKALGRNFDPEMTPLMPQGGRRQTRRATAVDAFADGLRGELRARIAGVLKASAPASEKADRAATLGAEGSLSLGVPAAIASELRALSAHLASREQGLRRIDEEIDFYAAHDLPVAALLVDRLEKQLPSADPVELLRRGLVAAHVTSRADASTLATWLTRAAALCGDGLVQALPGESALPELHDPAPGSELGGTVLRTAAPGVRKNDGQVLRRPLVESVARPAEPAPPALAAAAPPHAVEEEPVLELKADDQIEELEEAEVIGTGPISAPVDVEVISAPVEVVSAPVEVVSAPVELAASVEVVSGPVELAASIEVVSGPVEVVSGPVEVVSAPVEVVAAAEIVSEPAELPAAAPSAPAEPPAAAAVAKPGGDLWADVSSDAAWASIALPEGAHSAPADPWESHAAPAKEAAAAPAGAAAEPAKEG